MQPLSDATCLERMCGIIGGSEEFLLATVAQSVRRKGLARHSPRSQAAWRESIRGLSDLIFQAAFADDGYEGAQFDPIVAYGVLRARAQVARGVDPSRWVELLALYRDAYLELMRVADLSPSESDACCAFVRGVFERFEAGFHAVAASAGDASIA
jgi:hypothetical protein